ncbi:MAG TPA: hypothetical protein VH678_05820 [Xanthobacteraceae bacterium]
MIIEIINGWCTGGFCPDLGRRPIQLSEWLGLIALLRCGISDAIVASAGAQMRPTRCGEEWRLVYGTDWTGERVLERLTTAIKAAVRPNSISQVSESGKICGPVDGLDLLRVAELALGKNSELHKHFSAFAWAKGRGQSLSDMLAERGWSHSNHDRLRWRAAEVIAKYLNTRRVVESGGEDKSHQRAAPATLEARKPKARAQTLGE